MSAIVTPELVRRYIQASAGEPTAPSTFERLIKRHHVDEIVRHMGIDRAKLGILAAADMLRASFYANWTPNEEPLAERFVRGEIRGMILAAGVDPKAWEATR